MSILHIGERFTIFKDDVAVGPLNEVCAPSLNADLLHLHHLFSGIVSLKVRTSEATGMIQVWRSWSHAMIPIRNPHLRPRLECRP